MQSLEQKRFLLIEEVAAYLRVPTSTVRHWLRVGKLKGHRPGRRVLIARTELDRFIAWAAEQ